MKGEVAHYNTTYECGSPLEVDTRLEETVELTVIDSMGEDINVSLTSEETKKLIDQLSAWKVIKGNDAKNSTN